MSRTIFMYPPNMLPRATNPETAQVIVYQPIANEETSSKVVDSTPILVLGHRAKSH
jgi:hypothetical protein